jgi:diguanylate cyclase (GGDEF)-like protein
MMPHTNGDECNAICRKLNEAIARDMAAAKFSLTASIGHATFEATPATINDALREADQALYAAKSAGKSCVQGAQNDNPIESPQPAQ